VSGLPDAPVIVREFDAGLLPAPPRALAISDDASCVLLSSPGAVYRLSATGRTSVVTTVTAVASLAFFPDSTSGAIGDPLIGAVYVFQLSASGNSSRVLTTGLTGLGMMSADDDGQTLYITKPDGRC